MFSGKQFQVDGAEIEKTGEEKLLVMPYFLARKFSLEELKDVDER